MEMLSAILLACVSIGLFIYSIFLFQGKGPIPTTLYMLAKPEERKKMKNKAEYRFTGIVMLTLSLNFILMAMKIIFSIGWISKVIIVIFIGLSVYVLVYAIIEMIKL